MDRQDVTAWVAAYERAWRAAGVDALADIFTPDAVYRQGPYEAPLTGLSAIGRMWEQERSGPDEGFTMSVDVVAVEEDTAVVRVQVQYGGPVEQEYRDLWVIRFTSDRRCREFEEWPFSPDRPIATR
ncbi:nuclear transport factor 2 family protein [Rugosimonospora acidiphila]